MSRGPFDPSFEQLPDRLPIFPLAGVLLLPGGKLPLNIFEPRYLAMFDDALASNRLIGMIQPSETVEGDAPPAIYATGCVGRITAYSETDDSRYLTTLSGLIRFEIAEELPTGSYRLIRPLYERFSGDLKEDHSEIDRDRLLAALSDYFEANSIEGDWETIEQTGDENLVTSLSMICPLKAAEKQALLEAMTLSTRAKTLTAIMEMSTHDRNDESAASHH